ncbi:hypothetical protein L1276_000970 [Flavobacterium sp. HSC-32F16]|uniref:hypothetical protein n=1 Tax=Flavobacterium sp. HSC-32F16 TaxID=2910964 RepID=UPI0020A429BE|nr:hypothetical protein [Flavobacterium sp. HSC-32F16]MCP2025830.1 hypothetical protein [Flavobacterium sp. HSC-32F16]
MKKLHNVMLLLVLLFSIHAVLYAQQPKKENLSVLFVGFDPAVPVSEEIINSPAGTGGMSPERFREDMKTRYNAFESYLKEYFTTVKAVDVKSYKMEMSKNYDVTIFDQSIDPWEKAQYSPKYKPAKYLTEDFDFATVFIGHTAPLLGGSIGLKLDWLCLCLDADAHHLKSEHPIFKGPFPVKLTMVVKPTPDGIFHYESGKDIPKEIPMWRVQTEGYLEGKGYRLGLVSRGDGFTDSPDAEYISGGVSSKDVGAVAIGRHGNFLLWGFSASPDYMTDEAKQVFANAVVYIKDFKGKKPIARKYDDRIIIRTEIDDMIAKLNQESFEKFKGYMAEVNISMKEGVKKLSDKKQSGAKLTEMEESILEAQSQPIPIPTWEQYLQQTAQSFYKPEYLKNVDKLKKYLLENKKFMYYDEKGIYVDEDVKKLGIGNNDIKLLQKCITLLKSGKETELANAVLLRYTGMKKTAQEWEKWLTDNSSKLFFTEAGGYKWLIDTTK